jgi:hypothetical protein
MKAFSQLAFGLRHGRKQILHANSSVSCQALLRDFSTSSPEAGKNASGLSRDSLLIAGALTVASGGVLYYAMRQLDIPEVAEAAVVQGPKSPDTL